MGQTIEELFFEALPTDLYRHGTMTSPQLHKPRTTPPRQADQVHDVKIYTKNGIDYVDATSGGISTFNMPNLRFGNRWWKLPKGTKIPSGLRVSRDAGINHATGQIHYTIRPLHDMPLSTFITLLQQLSAHAVPTFAVPTRQVK
ncbi:hypothetical protein [Dyella acidisoli]|uniref:Tse2 family ADP-ribosyltransferase toxin n=1 Tax=Dyella acidisoli TaxID=1867834 RepID=UPI0024E0EAB7|nr:hypothetical protein [Dyella acidisoli]